MAIEDAPINRYPAGFLGFADIKAMGRNPRTLGNNVVSVLEMESFYSGERVRLTTTTANIVGPFIVVTATSPFAALGQNKGFRLESMEAFGASASLAAGDEMRFQMFAQPPGALMRMEIGPSSPTYVGAAALGDAPRFGHTLDRPIVLPPETLFGLLVTRCITAGPFLTTLNLVGVVIDW